MEQQSVQVNIPTDSTMMQRPLNQQPIGLGKDLQTPSTEEVSDPSQGSMPYEGATYTNSLQISDHLVSSLPSSVIHGYGDVPHVLNDKYTSKFEGGHFDEDKRKEYKKRSKSWTRIETLKLTKARGECDSKFRRSGRNAELWDEIASVLQSPNFSWDGQQCKEKWEKLTSEYKEVCGGAGDKNDHMDHLMSSKRLTNDRSLLEDGVEVKRAKAELVGEQLPNWNPIEPSLNGSMHTNLKLLNSEEATRKSSIPQRDLSVMRELLKGVIARQQAFFKELLDGVEHKELLREQIRHEREERWRAEERAQRYVFHNAMIMLTQRLLGERPPVLGTATVPPAPVVPLSPHGLLSPKKRSKNWKRSEVLHLIRFRRGMESRFLKSYRRAGLWEELGEKLGTLGITRDGKQCREKWDKLMAEYKDVIDGRKEEESSPYFAELTTFLGKSKCAELAVQAAVCEEHDEI